jgi:hypothetical protein
MKFCKNLPAEMRIDYIRLYQDPSDPTHTVSCSPPSHPTAEFIEGHPERYADWKDYDGLFPVGFGFYEFSYLILFVCVGVYAFKIAYRKFNDFYNNKPRYIPDHNHHMDVLHHHMSTKVKIGMYHYLI